MFEALLLKLSRGEHLPEPLPTDPMPLFMQWFAEAARDPNAKTPDAMALATATRDGTPSVRYVLCKHIEACGAIHFFSNLQSRKAVELTDNPRAAAAFHWEKRARQVRAEGPVTRLTDQQNDEYFASRPLASKIGAWASRQSQVLESREQFVRDVLLACSKLHINPAALLADGPAIHVPRPSHWGGFRLQIERIELWCGADGRLHDRAAWDRNAFDPTDTPPPWRATRLYP